jgi:hypothetical protein
MILNYDPVGLERTFRNEHASTSPQCRIPTIVVLRSASCWDRTRNLLTCYLRALLESSPFTSLPSIGAHLE